MEERPKGLARGWARRWVSGARIGSSAARLATRGLFGRAGEKDGDIAGRLARELDQMKGMAMKVGQILSYFDGILPEQAHAALRGLQQGQHVVAFETLKALLESDFGAPLAELFDEVDPTPVASASIGQVYKGRFAGRPVAIKIQYPGIRDTIQADFGKLQKIAGLASLASAVDGRALVDDLQARFVEECDYQAEAHNQNVFRAAFADDVEVHVPAAIPNRCRAHVLTTEWCEGRDFYRFCDSASAAQKNHAARVLIRFAYTSLFGLGALNADPHPGNTLFPEGSAVVFLDFGCVRIFDAPFLDAHRRLTEVVVCGRRADFQDALMATGMVAKVKRFDFDLHWETLRHELLPYHSPQFRFTTEFMKQGLEYGRYTNPNLRVLKIPPQWIWVARQQWGLHAVLAKLGAEGDFRELLREALERPVERKWFWEAGASR